MSAFAKRWRIKRSAGSIAADVIIYTLVTLLCLTCIIPFLNILAMSLSDPQIVIRQEVFLIPKGITTAAYELIMKTEGLWTAYGNTLIYLVSIVVLSDIVTVLAAFPLSQPGLAGRKFCNIFFLIPMFFGGGLIPSYLLIVQLGLYDTRWAIILPSLLSIWNIILVRTYFKNLPGSLFESAKIDGAGNVRMLFSIAVPLAKPIIAVITLYMAVGVWNSWFGALLYLPSRDYQPLQYYLANLLVFTPNSLSEIQDGASQLQSMLTNAQLKYAMIIFVSLPIICLYPFLQKYFIKGVLIGSLKE